MDPWLRPQVERGGSAAVAVLIRITAGGELPAHVRVVSRFGDIVTARVAGDALEALREHPAVHSLKAARPIRPEPAAGALVAAAPPRRLARRNPGVGPVGRGAVIAVIDWGLDVTHPNFQRADGGTRLLALWDQRPTGGRARHRFGYGRILSRRRIDRALASADPFADLDYAPADFDADAQGTHGTHVLDIAAGAPRRGPGGIAPGAELVFVHLAAGAVGPQHIGNSVSLLEAIDFASEVAGERPLVINLSLGSHAGPHDGSTLVEQALDAFCVAQPGRVIVQSAGNYGRRPIHASGLLAVGRRATVGWSVSPTDETVNELDLWYPGHASAVVRLRDDDGRIAAVAPPDSHGAIVMDGRPIGRFAHRTIDPNNQDNHVALIVDPRATDVTRWTVEVEPTAAADADRWHAWIERDESSASSQSRLDVGEASRQGTTGTIANGRWPIVVGALDPATGATAAFSSRGPTRDGRAKPDVLAPGVGIVAARSVPADPAWTGHPSLTRKSGTSMAAPHVTGAVALLFEAAGRALTIGEVRDALGIADGAPPPRLDVDAALARVSARAAESYALALEEPAPRLPAPAPLAALAERAEAPWAASPARLFDAFARPSARARWEALAPWIEVVARPGASPRRALAPGDVLVERVLGDPTQGFAHLLAEPTLAAAARPRWSRLVLRARVDGPPQLRALPPPRRRAPSSSSRALGEAASDYPDQPARARVRVHRFGLQLVADAGVRYEAGRDKIKQGIAALTLALVGSNQYSPRLAGELHRALGLTITGFDVDTAAEEIGTVNGDADLVLRIIAWLRDDQKLLVHLDEVALTTLAQASAVAYAWKVVDAAAGRELNPAHEFIRVLDREAAPYLVHRWLWTTQTLFTNLAWSAEALVNALVAARAATPVSSWNVERAVTALWQRFTVGADPLEAIRTDATLTSHLAYRLLWNQPIDPAVVVGVVPEDAAINSQVMTRCLELVLARFTSLGKAATESRKQRRELLDRFKDELSIIGQFITVGEGQDLIQSSIAKANAPPFASRLKIWPPLTPPLFAVAARTELACEMSVSWDHWTSAFGARYHWELLKMRAGDWEPVSGAGGLTVLGRRLEREMEYTWTDYQRLRGSVVNALGPTGFGAETVAGALAVIRALGTLIKSFFDAIGRKPYERTINVGGPGVYMVRCSAGQSSQDGPLVRVPSVAYEVVIVYPGDQLSARYATMQLEQQRQLAQQNVELRLLLQLGLIPAAERAATEAIIADNQRELTSDLGALLAHQRTQLVAQREALDGPPRGDLDIDRAAARKELTQQLEQLDKRIGHRADRLAGVAGKKLVRALGTLVTDRAGPPLHLAIEFAVMTETPGLVSVTVLDATAVNSGYGAGAGGTVGQAVKAALLSLLESDVTGYGRGFCTILVPVDGQAHQQLTFRVEANLSAMLVEAIEGLTMIVSVVALLAAPFTAGASLAILVPMGIIGIVPSAYRLATRAAHGTLHWDLQTAMEVVDVVSGFIGLGQTATGSLRMLRLSKGFMVLGHGANGLGVMMGSYALLEQIDQVKDDPSLSPAQKRAALMSLVGNQLFQHGISVGTSLASKARFDLDASGVDPARLPPSARPLPEATAVSVGAARRRLDPSKPLVSAEPDLVRQAKSIVGQDVTVLRDPTLRGETAEVRYRLDRLGFVAEVVIVLGPTAGKAHLPSHAAVARTLLKFTGVIGKARTLLEWARALVTGRKDRVPGKRAFEARAELEKLPAQLADYLDAAPERIARGELTPDQVDAYVADLEAQLERHHDALYSDERGRGVIAAEDNTGGPSSAGRPATGGGVVGRFQRLADSLQTALGVEADRVRVLLAPSTQKHISVEAGSDGSVTVRVPIGATDDAVQSAGQAHAELARRKAAGTPWSAADEARLRGRPDAEPGHRWERRGDELVHVGDPPRRYDPTAGAFVAGDPSTPPAPRRRPGAAAAPGDAATRRKPAPRPDAPTAPPAPGRKTPRPAPAGPPVRSPTPGDPPPPSPDRQARHASLFTDPAASKAFLERLRAFRGNENPHPPKGFAGGEGQLYHSDLTPDRALKRWYTDRITDKKDSPGKPTSVQLLRDAAKLVDANPELAKHLEVVRIHEEGPDWIVRDFDPDSVEARDPGLQEKERANAAISASLQLLRMMQKQQPQNKALRTLLSRLSSLPPSANVHWAHEAGRILIIDLM
jgi:subtilisin family serine protease